MTKQQKYQLALQELRDARDGIREEFKNEPASRKLMETLNAVDVAVKHYERA